MKLINVAMLGVAMLFSFAGVASAETLDVKIPFAFSVSGKQLPAGTYRIERATETSSSILRFEGERGTRAEMLVQTTPMQGVNPAREPALIFVPGETANRLTAIWNSSRGGYEVSGSHRDAKQLGQIAVRGTVF